MDLKFKPIFLGGLISESLNRSPALVPNKGVYNFKYDIPRLAKYYQIPLNIPKNPSVVMFEKTSLAAMRFLTAVDLQHPECTEELSRELWLRAWSRDEDIYDERDFLEASRKAGVDDNISNLAISRIKDAEIKNILRNRTTEALDHGAFGVPTIITYINGKPELVFGSDRFPILAMIIGEEWKGPQKELSRWKV